MAMVVNGFMIRSCLSWKVASIGIETCTIISDSNGKEDIRGCSGLLSLLQVAFFLRQGDLQFFLILWE
jgi:hypothetical protein